MHKLNSINSTGQHTKSDIEAKLKSPQRTSCSSKGKNKIKFIQMAGSDLTPTKHEMYIFQEKPQDINNDQ